MELTTKETLLMYGLLLESEFFSELRLVSEADGELFLKLQQEVYGINEKTTPEELAERNKEQFEAAEGLLNAIKEQLSRGLSQ